MKRCCLKKCFWGKNRGVLAIHFSVWIVVSGIIVFFSGDEVFPYGMRMILPWLWGVGYPLLVVTWICHCQKGWECLREANAPR